MKFAAVVLSLLFGTNAFAYTMHRCEVEDQSKIINILFDAADNYFVFAKLIVDNGSPIQGILQGTDHIRPRPIDPNHAPLTLKFDQSVFVFGFDATSATLTTDGTVEQMACCDDLGPDHPCAGRAP